MLINWFISVKLSNVVWCDGIMISKDLYTPGTRRRDASRWHKQANDSASNLLHRQFPVHEAKNCSVLSHDESWRLMFKLEKCLLFKHIVSCRGEKSSDAGCFGVVSWSLTQQPRGEERWLPGSRRCCCGQLCRLFYLKTMPLLPCVNTFDTVNVLQIFVLLFVYYIFGKHV